MVENASLALTRIAEALANSPAEMEALCHQGLISNAMQVNRCSNIRSLEARKNHTFRQAFYSSVSQIGPSDAPKDRL